jgi:hypothetical protein
LYPDFLIKQLSILLVIPAGFNSDSATE